jgi:hypothetical protein
MAAASRISIPRRRVSISNIELVSDTLIGYPPFVSLVPPLIVLRESQDIVKMRGLRGGRVPLRLPCGTAEERAIWPVAVS